MRDRPYYSLRTGTNPSARSLDLAGVRRVFKGIYCHLEAEGYFQEALGYDCVDAGPVAGYLGPDLEGVLLLELRKPDLFPVRDRLEAYSEEDLFDIIEFLYDHVSKPTERQYHQYSDCGWHCSQFDRGTGRMEFRERVNRVLKAYDGGYELSAEGEILALPDSGLEALLEAPLPTVDPENIEARVDAARRKFRRFKASLDERRDAVRDLADVLEYLRPRIKKVLTTKDESDLFNLANNFGLRHHNELQKVRYDQPIWYSWLYYYYLATIHAVVRLIKKGEIGGQKTK
jgi:hypothetical protein